MICMSFNSKFCQSNFCIIAIVFPICIIILEMYSHKNEHSRIKIFIPNNVANLKLYNWSNTNNFIIKYSHRLSLAVLCLGHNVAERNELRFQRQTDLFLLLFYFLFFLGGVGVLQAGRPGSGGHDATHSPTPPPRSGFKCWFGMKFFISKIRLINKIMWGK